MELARVAFGGSDGNLDQPFRVRLVFSTKAINEQGHGYDDQDD